MPYKNIFATFIVSIGLTLSAGTVIAENDPSSKYKVLSIENSSLSISSINSFLDNAEASIKKGNMDQAVNNLEKAKNVSSLLINYYTDLNSSFQGIDALIPRELSKKNKNVINLLAKANILLATIHQSKGDPELAVPLLVDVVKSLTPANPMGAKAYQKLFELGFVEIPYRGASEQ